jgi:hypothetical protein
MIVSCLSVGRLCVIPCGHHHVVVKELDHLLTVPVSHIQKSLQWFSLVSFAFCWVVFLSVWVICYVAFDLHVVSIFSCSSVFCPKLGLYLIPLQSLYLFSDVSKPILLFSSYGLVGKHSRFGETYCLLLQGCWILGICALFSGCFKIVYFCPIPRCLPASPRGLKTHSNTTDIFTAMRT